MSFLLCSLPHATTEDILSVPRLQNKRGRRTAAVFRLVSFRHPLSRNVVERIEKRFSPAPAKSKRIPDVAPKAPQRLIVGQPNLDLHAITMPFASANFSKSNAADFFIFTDTAPAPNMEAKKPRPFSLAASTVISVAAKSKGRTRTSASCEGWQTWPVRSEVITSGDCHA